MKKIVKWLADISGVTKKIRREERAFIGNNLLNESYWFNGGLMYGHPLENISNFATLYGERLKDGIYPNISDLRDTLYKMSGQNLSVYKDREVCGYWSDHKEPHFIKKEDYNGEKGYRPQLRIKYE